MTNTLDKMEKGELEDPLEEETFETGAGDADASCNHEHVAPGHDEVTAKRRLKMIMRKMVTLKIKNLLKRS